nr:hypothetical protein [Tanacetum cinerariifolium]
MANLPPNDLNANLPEDEPVQPVHGPSMLGFAPAMLKIPNNNNGWIEWDIPLGGEMDEPMVEPGFDEEEMDDNDDDDIGTRTTSGHPLAIIAPGVATQPQVIDDAADSISIGEIHPRVATMEGQVLQMASHAVQLVSKLEEMETRVQQVESRVDIHPSGQTAVPREDVIVGLRLHVQTLQTALHGAELQNQQLRNRVVEMESHEGTMMSYMLWMEERLTVLEKRLLGPPPGPL